MVSKPRLLAYNDLPWKNYFKLWIIKIMDILIKLWHVEEIQLLYAHKCIIIIVMTWLVLAYIVHVFGSWWHSVIIVISVFTPGRIPFTWSSSQWLIQGVPGIQSLLCCVVVTCYGQTCTLYLYTCTCTVLLTGKFTQTSGVPAVDPQGI